MSKPTLFQPLQGGTLAGPRVLWRCPELSNPAPPGPPSPVGLDSSRKFDQHFDVVGLLERDPSEHQECFHGLFAGLLTMVDHHVVEWRRARHGPMCHFQVASGFLHPRLGLRVERFSHRACAPDSRWRSPTKSSDPRPDQPRDEFQPTHLWAFATLANSDAPVATGGSGFRRCRPRPRKDRHRYRRAVDPKRANRKARFARAETP